MSSTENILRPEELPFEVPEDLKEAIDELIAAIERDDFNLDMYQDEVEGWARLLPSEQDRFVYDYYANSRWRRLGRNVKFD